MKKYVLKWGLLSLFCALTSMAGAQTTSVSQQNARETEQSYSGIEYKSISPNEETELAVDQNTFVITFTGEVKINEDESNIIMAKGQPAEKFESIVADNEYSKTWTLTVPSSIVQQRASEILSFRVVAYDKDNKPVAGNSGKYQTYTFKVGIDISQLGVFFYPVSGTPVESLNTIIVYCEDGIYCSWNNVTDATITNEKGDVIGKSTICIEENDSSSSVNKMCTMLFDGTATLPGIYRVTIPSGYFIIGSDNLNSPTITLTYYIIDKSNIDYVLTLNPDNGDVLSSFSTITVMANADIQLNEAYEDDVSSIVVRDDKNRVVAHAFDYDPIDNDFTDGNIGYTFKLDKEIVAGGRYTYTIPAGFFCLGSETNLSEQLSASVRVNGEKDTELTVTLDPEDGATVNSLSSIKVYGFLSIDWNHKLDEITVTDVNSGKVVATVVNSEEIVYDEDNYSYYDLIIFNLSEEITADGIYQLTIPEGFFLLGSNHQGMSKEITATYKVDSTVTGINKVFQNTTGDGVYYNLNGQRVTSPRNGIYILNGKKVIVK